MKPDQTAPLKPTILSLIRLTLVNVNAPVVATTSWWLDFSAQVVVIKVKKPIPVDIMFYL